MLSDTELHYPTDAEVLFCVRFQQDTRATRLRRRFQTSRCETHKWKEAEIHNPPEILKARAASDHMHLWTVCMDYQLLEHDLLILPLFRAVSTPQWLLKLMHKSRDIGPARTLRSSGADAGSGRAGCGTPHLGGGPSAWSPEPRQRWLEQQLSLCVKKKGDSLLKIEKKNIKRGRWQPI